MKYKTKPFVFIFISSLLLNFALVFPAYVSWLVFLFLIPLFYVVFLYPGRLSFVHGFFWGVAFFLFHFSGFALLFYIRANNKLSVCIPLFMSAYCALYSGIWFVCARYTSQFLKNSIVSIFISWAIWTYLYFAWMRYGSLWILGKFVGYPFCFPLLPLANNGVILSFLPFFSKGFVFLLIIVSSLCISLFLVSFKKRYLFCSFFVLSPFLYSKFTKQEKIIIPKKIKHIGYISPIASQNYTNSLDAAQEIFYAMVDLIDKKPHIDVIVMPESSYNFCLNEQQYIIDLWYKNILDKDVSLFIGAPYKDGTKIYNALYWIKGGQIKKVYHKTNLMAFTEYVAPFWQHVPYIKNLFLDENNFFTHGKSCLITFKLCKNITMKPLICSDFFIGKRKTGKQLKKSSFSAALIIVNDHAFPLLYLRNLMFLSARLEAINRKKDILYVGYYFAAWISKDGSFLLL